MIKAKSQLEADKRKTIKQREWAQRQRNTRTAPVDRTGLSVTASPSNAPAGSEREMYEDFEEQDWVGQKDPWDKL